MTGKVMLYSPLKCPRRWICDAITVGIIVDHRVEDDKALFLVRLVQCLGIFRNHPTGSAPARREIKQNDCAVELRQRYRVPKLIGAGKIRHDVADIVARSRWCSLGIVWPSGLARRPAPFVVRIGFRSEFITVIGTITWYLR